VLSGMAKQSLHDRTKGRGVMSLISDTRDKLITVICDMNPHVIPPSLRLHHDEIDSALTDMINEIERRQREHVRKTYNATSFYDRNTIEAVSAEVFQQIRGEE